MTQFMYDKKNCVGKMGNSRWVGLTVNTTPQKKLRTEKSPEHLINIPRTGIKKDSSLRTNSTWQEETDTWCYRKPNLY